MNETELHQLTEACRQLPPAKGTYLEKEYLVNVFLTVLDLQMHNRTVDAAVAFYRQQRQQEVRTFDDLAGLLAKYPNDRNGNRELAQFLWGNNHWTRIEWLRNLVPFLKQAGLTSHEALHQWAHNSDFRKDFRGRVKYLDIAAYKWLTMRLGVDTVKPDVHLHRFVEGVVGRRVTDSDLVVALEEVAHRLKLSARELDWSLWEYQRRAPGAI